MCGIAGWVNLSEGSNQSKVVDANRINQMLAAIKHRGPDDSGIQIVDNVGLGHQRLSIIDLSADGHQPMSSADGHLWVTFNGEIYNYQSLRQRLKKQGYSFKTQTDTEVILAAYHSDPDNFLNNLEGMFAFALLDTQRQKLILARDRFGEKPFYYAFVDGQHLAFASEIKALLTQPEINTEISDHQSPEAIKLGFSTGFVAAPHTAFNNINVLPAGHWAEFDLQTNQWAQPPARYFDINQTCTKPGIKTETSLSSEQALKTFEALLTKSVKARLQADVPLGLFLSGGLDSSAIACVATDHFDEPLNSFNVGFDCPQANKNRQFDESEKAALVSKTLGCIHHSVICTADDFINLSSEILPTVDNLNAEHLVPMAMVSQLARQHVTVALSGDGADELLGGYNGYKNLATLRQFANFPCGQSVIGLGAQLAQNLTDSSVRKRQWDRVKAFAGSDNQTDYLAYRHPETILNGFQLLVKPQGLISDWLNASNNAGGIYKNQGYLNLLDANSKQRTLQDDLWLDLSTALPEAILMKSDAMSMRCGLEVRSPFLDTELAQFLWHLPEGFKRQYGASKWLIRQFLRSRLPQSIWQQQKSGFSAPFGVWLQTHPQFYNHYVQLALDLITQHPTLGFDEQAVRRLFEAHQCGQQDNTTLIWRLIIFLHWYHYFGQGYQSGSEQTPKSNMVAQ